MIAVARGNMTKQHYYLQSVRSDLHANHDALAIHPKTLTKRTGTLPSRTRALPNRPGTLPNRPGTLPNRPGTLPNSPRTLLNRRLTLSNPIICVISNASSSSCRRCSI